MAQRRRDHVDARAVGQAGVADRARFVDAPADLADDALADVEELLVVAEADAGLLDLAVDLDVDVLGAVDHDVGDVVARQQRLERTVAQHVVADVLEQFFLLGDRHREILDRDDVVDDVADFLARAVRLELGELRQVDRVDQRRKDLRSWCRSRFRCARAAACAARRRSAAPRPPCAPAWRQRRERAPDAASAGRGCRRRLGGLPPATPARRAGGIGRRADAVVVASFTEHDRLPLASRDCHFFFELQPAEQAAQARLSSSS